MIMCRYYCFLISLLLTSALPLHAAIKDSARSVNTELSAYAQFEPKLSVNNNPVDASSTMIVSESTVRFTAEVGSGERFALFLVGPINTALVAVPDSGASGTVQVTGLSEQIGTGRIRGYVLLSKSPFSLPSNPYVVQRKGAALNALKTVQRENSSFRVGGFQFRLEEPESDLQISQTRMMQELSNRSTELSQNSDSGNESTPLVANDIQFASNSAKLNDKGMRQLDVLGRSLQKFRARGDNFPITMEGHTDDTGPAEYNQSLSEERAASARRYLLNNFGLPPESITTRGRGEYMPLENGTSARARSKNRRVEIRVAK